MEPDEVTQSRELSVNLHDPPPSLLRRATPENLGITGSNEIYHICNKITKLKSKYDKSQQTLLCYNKQ